MQQSCIYRVQHDDGARRTLKRCVHDRHAGVSSFEFKLLRRRTETSESRQYNILFYNTGTTAAYRRHYYYYTRSQYTRFSLSDDPIPRALCVFLFIRVHVVYTHYNNNVCRYDSECPHCGDRRVTRRRVKRSIK